MLVPDFAAFLEPVLRAFASVSGDTAVAKIRDDVAHRLSLTETDCAELLPSGRQPRFHNRLAWATIYLRGAGLLERPSRGIFRVTPQGHEALASGQAIDIAFLSRFPSFNEWRRRDGAGDPVDRTRLPQAPVGPTSTPEEQIDAEVLRHKVEGDLIERILAATPTFFEELVVEWLVKTGYGGSRLDAGQALGRSGDGGLDGVIKEDRLGLDAIYIQAKRWAPSHIVGRPDIQAFAGSLEGERARKGVFITTSSFSREAHDYVRRIEKKIVLVDGRALAAMMFEHGVGVRLKDTYEIKEVDEDYFSSDAAS